MLKNNITQSILTADVILRNLGWYCEINNIKSNEILDKAKICELRHQFIEFIREIEREGKQIRTL